MNISYKTDVTRTNPDPNKGTFPWENPGVKGSFTDIPCDAGEKVSNDTSRFETKQGLPAGKFGSGYNSK
jgi:hypothetical protein